MLKQLRYVAIVFCCSLGTVNASAATMADILFGPIGGPEKIVRLRTKADNSAQGSNKVYRGSNNGGEFLVEIDTTNPDVADTWETIDVFVASPDLNTNNDPWVYKTFCVENNEYFDPDTAYYATIDDVIYYNNGATPNGGAVADNVLVAYGLYAEGKLKSAIASTSDPTLFVYDNGAKAGSLQQFIWDAQSNLYYNTAFTGLSKDWNDAIEEWIGASASNGELADFYIDNVKVLNLWGGKKSNGEYKDPRQSQLILTAPSPIDGPVPEPMTLAMWSGLSILGLGIARRQRRKVSA